MRRLPPFHLERYFAHWEFNVDLQFSASDCESLSLKDLMERGSQPEREEVLNQWLGYTETPGAPALREGIAQLYDGLNADDILVLAPSEGIFLGLQAMLEEGDHALVTWPAYQSLYEVPDATGVRITHWPIQVINGRWTLDLDFLRDHIQPRTRALVVNFPHNPTGFIPTADEWNSLLEIAENHGLMVFSDEMYRELEHDPARRLPPACTSGIQHVSLSGMSKSYGLPGLRIGWLASRSRGFLERVSSMKDYTSICNSAPSEALARLALAHGPGLLDRNRERIATHLDLLRRTLEQFSHRIEFLEPDGGPILFPRFRDGTSSEEFSRSLVTEQSVLLLPGALFAMGNEFFRVGLGRADFPTALERVVKQLGKK